MTHLILIGHDLVSDAKLLLMTVNLLHTSQVASVQQVFHGSPTLPSHSGLYERVIAKLLHTYMWTRTHIYLYKINMYTKVPITMFQ